MTGQNNVKMFVAAHSSDDAIVIWASKPVLDDIKDRSPHVGDIFASERQHPPHTGLWVWEGVQNWSSFEMESDTDYIGVWRKPKGSEMIRAARGLYPFGDDE